MTLTAIILLLVVGLVLVILEILILPGFIVGVIGAGLMLVAILYAYYNHGTTVGNYILLSSTVITAIVLILIFRSNTWNKVTLHSNSDSKIEALDINIKEGDFGVTISRLAPMGKAMINNMQVEVQSFNGFINENTEIEVMKISSSKIIVNLKNKQS